MVRQDAIKLLAKLRGIVEHPNTTDEERAAALTRIQQIKNKWKIGQYESYEELRPNKNKSLENRRDVTLRFRVTQKEKNKLVALAKLENMSMSDFVRCKLFGTKEIK